MRIKGPSGLQISLTSIDETIPFFTNVDKNVTIDSDFYYDQDTDTLHVKMLNLASQAYCTIPSTLVPTGTTQDIDWNNGNFQKLDLGSASGDVTLTFSNSQSGGSYVLVIVQSATARTITWPAEVKWEGGSALSLSTGEDDIDIVSMIYDGSNFYVSMLNNMS